MCLLIHRQGVPINIIAICYCIFQTVMSFFPLFAAVTVETMNWGVSCSISHVFFGRQVASTQLLTCPL